MTLSYNKTISFPIAPKSFKVRFYGDPPVPAEEIVTQQHQSLSKGKTEATAFYQDEIKKLREEIAKKQDTLLTSINSNVHSTLNELDKRLPDLVIAIVERILPDAKIDGEQVRSIVVSMISEFSESDEKLDVYLCKADLDLLKGLSKPNAEDLVKENPEEGFASAIAGIFDGLDGDDSLLEGYPNVKFHEDETLSSGDCQVKSRFGLLDGRIATKLRKIEQELKGND